MHTLGIIGMGKMGQAIAAVLDRDETAGFIAFDRLNPARETELKSCDVVIEFTTPEAAPGVIRQCLEAGVPTVSGTTGWHESHLETILHLVKNLNGKFLYASNFSIGMNIMFALNARLAALMASYPEFEASLREIHHLHKKDAPSGTAYSLIEDVVRHHPAYKGFTLTSDVTSATEGMMAVEAIREGEVKGFHEVIWQSGKERLFIGHEAFDRSIFAEGAVRAAKWLIYQTPGVYTMRDIIQL